MRNEAQELIDLIEGSMLQDKHMLTLMKDVRINVQKEAAMRAILEGSIMIHANAMKMHKDTIDMLEICDQRIEELEAELATKTQYDLSTVEGREQQIIDNIPKELINNG